MASRSFLRWGDCLSLGGNPTQGNGKAKHKPEHRKIGPMSIIKLTMDEEGNKT
jgi:hypothetical protein